jgi:hypothetical protein
MVAGDARSVAGADETVKFQSELLHLKKRFVAQPAVHRYIESHGCELLASTA